MPRKQPQRRQIRHHEEIAVATLPRRHRVPLDCVHLDVDRHQVVAALGSAGHDVLEEVGGREPFTLQTPLHVGDPYDHRVDVAVSD